MQEQWEFIRLTLAMNGLVIAGAWAGLWRTQRREGYADRPSRVLHVRRMRRWVLPILALALVVFAVAPLAALVAPAAYVAPGSPPPLGLGPRILSAAISAAGALVVIYFRARLPREQEIREGLYGFGGFHDLFRRHDRGDRS